MYTMLSFPTAVPYVRVGHKLCIGSSSSQAPDSPERLKVATVLPSFFLPLSCYQVTENGLEASEQFSVGASHVHRRCG